MFNYNEPKKIEKKIRNKITEKLIITISILAFLCMIMPLVKSVYAYFINYTNEIVNNFTVSANRSITYNYYLLDDDSQIQQSQTEEAETGETITLNSSKIINNENYTFVKFKKGQTEYNLGDQFIMPDENIVIDEYYAYNYTITYELNGGTNNQNNPNKYTMLDTINLESATKEGYTFNGWYETISFDEPETTTITNRTGNITLYAKFTGNPKNYTVEHYKENLNGEFVKDELETETIQSQVGLNVIASAKSFDGFTYDSENENNIPSGTISSNEDLVLKLYYIRNSYNLTLNKNSFIDEVSLSETNKGTSVIGSYKYGEEVTVNAKLGSSQGYTYTFSGFSSNVAGTTVTNNIQDSTDIDKVGNLSMPAENITITAIGARTPIEYDITYVLNGGTNGNNPNKYTIEDTISLEDPTQDGYTFAGWYETSNFTEPATVSITNRTGDITLYAKWIQNEYRVIVHHYEENTSTSVADDEVLIGGLGESYTARNLIPTLDGQGHIIETDGRDYLNPAQYSCVSSVGNTTGVFTEQDIVVTYYYRVATFEITGEAGAGGSISSVDETVRYGEDSTKTITITPDIGNRVQEIRVNNQVVSNYTENQTTRVVTLPVFTNVTENKHITVTFMPVPKVAKIIEVPTGYEATLLNTEYEYLSQAIAAVPTNVDGFTIQIISDVINETNTVENKYIKIDLNGYDITGSSTSNPTLKAKSGSLQVIGLGSVVNDVGNAVEIEPTGTFTLGEDDGVVSQFAPIIEGKLKGVLRKSATDEITGDPIEGTFNFYDGIIRGETSAIDGGATDTPSLYDPTTTINADEKYETILNIVSGIEALIGRTRYQKLEQAINAANNIKGTSADQIEIDVVADIGTNEGTDPNRNYVLDNTKNIKLDLNGHTITTGLNNYVITNRGKLEIIDSSYVPANGENEEVAGTGNILSTTSHTILNTNNGELTVTSGTITSTLSGKYAIHNSGSGKLTVNGGKVESTYSNAGTRAIFSEGNSQVTVAQNAYIKGTGNAIYTKDSAILTINGGTIDSDNKGTDSYTVNHTSLSNVTITGGTINSPNAYAVRFYNNNNAVSAMNNVTITGGTITSEKGGITNGGNTQITINNINITSKGNYYAVSNANSKGIIYINGGTYSASYELFNNSGTMTVTAGTYTLSSAAVGSNSGTLTISNLTFDNASYGIKNNSGGNLNLTNITINSTNLAVDNAGTATLNNVTIDSTTTSNVLSNSGTITLNDVDISTTKGKGIYNMSSAIVNMVSGTINAKERGIDNSGGTVTLGTKDGSVSDSDIIIESTTKEGIYSTGSINYYDGTIRGLKSLGVIVGRVNDIETGKNIVITENGNVQIANLGVQNYVAQIGAAQYTNLRDAVSACAENTQNPTEIVIIDDFHITSSELALIPSNKNIKINLDGHTIISNCTDEMIKNQGTLIITDKGTDENGVINSYGKNVINNEGNLTIENNTKIEVIMNGNSNNISNTSKAIINTGELLITNASFNTTSINGYITGIENNDSGIITIDNATIGNSNHVTYGIVNNSSNKITINNIDIIGVYYNSVTNNSSGTIEINGGIYRQKILNNSDGKIKITGGTINSSTENGKSSGEIEITGGTLKNVINQSGGTSTIKVSGTTQTTKTGKITNNANCTVIITGGEVKNTSGYGIENKGYLTIGTKDNSSDTTNPYIYGGSYGVYHTGQEFNFYDGIIEGKTNQTTYGTIDDKETDFEIMSYKPGDSPNFTVNSGREIKVLVQEDIVEVLSTGATYSSLQEAIDAVNTGATGDTLVMLKSITIMSNSSSVTIPNNKKIILDLNDKSITASNTNTFVNNGQFEIKDDSLNKTGMLINTESTIIKSNSGSVLTLTSGTIRMDAKGGTNNYIDAIKSEGTTILQGISFLAQNAYINALHLEGSGTATITACNVRSTASGDYFKGIINDSTGNVQIIPVQLEDVTFSGRADSIINNNSGIILIDNGTFNDITNNGTGAITINDGKIGRIYNYSTGNITIYNGSTKDVFNYGNATVTVEGGKVSGSDYGIKNDAGGTIKVNGGTLTGSYWGGIYVGSNSTGRIEITGGTIYRGISNNGTSTLVVSGNPTIRDSSSAIYNNTNATAIITGGTITATSTDGDSSSYSGINNKGTVTIGTEDSELKEEPVISGGVFGVYNTGTFNFYDGIISGTNKYAICGEVSEIQSGKTIEITTPNNVETAKLVSIDYIAQVGQTQYNNLADAITACGNNGEITIVNDFSMITDDEVEIASGNNITINLNGKTITGFAEDSLIINNGLVTIKDDATEQDGKIASRSNDIITSIGTLNLNSGNVYQNFEEKYAVNNTGGTLNLNGATISSDLERKAYGIKDSSSGSVTVSSGTISNFKYRNRKLKYWSIMYNWWNN